jgi:uncharacterized protein YmfQ (DUF2313 family)
MSFFDKIIVLTKQLYPTGRAFRVAVDSYKLRLHKALAISEAQAYTDALSTLNSALPDNDDFTEEDASAWEHRLGLITNELVSLANRKAAIIRKMNHPGTVPARQHYLYLESQLQAAGFDVYVHENRFHLGGGVYETRTPDDVTGSSANIVQHNDIQHGDAQHGTGIWNVIVNNLDEELDSTFNVGSNLRSTFFIGGPYVGDYADVDENRKLEFRQLILKIKPVQTAGYLFINYV